MARLAWLDTPRFDWHEGGDRHPERPARLRSIRETLEQHGWAGKLLCPQVTPASRELLDRVHDPKYLARLERLCDFGGGQLDADTYVTGHGQSWDAALLAAGAVETAVGGVLAAQYERAFCAVRPPGHHATRTTGMGFCLINNVVVGALAALERREVERVAIFDFDVHHGNGTEELTYQRGDVFYASTHQYPAYPFSGAAERTGEGEGRGKNLNVPLAPGSGDDELLEAWQTQVEPALIAYRPDLLLLSAGFDADSRDPLAELNVTTAGFAELSTRLVKFADAHCSGRIVSVLEGGYNLDALAEDVCAHLETMA